MRFILAALVASLLSLSGTASAAWVYVPDTELASSFIAGAQEAKIRVYIGGIKTDIFFPDPVYDPVTLALTPYNDFMLDTTTSTFVPLTQTNIVNYGLTEPSAFLNGGTIIAGIDEAAIADTFTTTAPWILWAYLTGWLVALPLALMLNFVRGRVNSSV